MGRAPQHVFHENAALAALSALAWMALILGGSTSFGLPELCTGRLIGTMPSGAELGFVLSWISPSALMLSWGVMVVAMMLPLTFGPLSHVRKRSLTRERDLSIALFLLGYLLLWLVAGVAILSLVIALRVIVPMEWGLFLVSLTATFLWQVSPAKQIALNRGHGHPPLRHYARGPLAGFLFGSAHGAWCFVSCGPIMLTVLLAPSYSAVWMVFAALYIWAERLESPRAPSFKLRMPTRALKAARYHARSWISV